MDIDKFSTDDRGRINRLSPAERQQLFKENKCFRCRKVGHRAVDCRANPSRSNNGNRNNGGQFKSNNPFRNMINKTSAEERESINKVSAETNFELPDSAIKKISENIISKITSQFEVVDSADSSKPSGKVFEEGN